jgi:hypothetical protein
MKLKKRLHSRKHKNLATSISIYLLLKNQSFIG